jgi:hypothetical protein
MSKCEDDDQGTAKKLWLDFHGQDHREATDICVCCVLNENEIRVFAILLCKTFVHKDPRPI